MRQALCCATILVLSALCVAQSNPKPEKQTAQPSNTSSKDAATPKKLERVHANLQGFELSPKPANAGTQIGGATRGMGTSTQLLAPNKGRAFTLNPLFQWSNPNSNIKEYTFRLLDSERNMLFETSVSGTSLKYPSSASPLAPGGNYFWTVQPSVMMLGEQAEPAEIVIVGPPERRQIESQLADKPENSRQRAELFVEQRLWYDAIESYTKLLESKPDDVELLELRGNIYDQLPQTKKAAALDLESAKRKRGDANR